MSTRPSKLDGALASGERARVVPPLTASIQRFVQLHINNKQQHSSLPVFPTVQCLLENNNITMSSDPSIPLTESSMTIRSDSEQYSGNGDDTSPSPPSSSSSPMILYKPPTVWGLLRGAAINLILPFVNGLMLGFGELFAHEAAFRLGWGGTKVRILLFWKALNSVDH